MTKKERTAGIFKILSQKINPKPELNFQTRLDLLVAVMLSAQTTDKAVNAVTGELWKKCRTAEDYVQLGADRLAEMIHSIGMYRQKARHVCEMCQLLILEYNGEVPADFDALTALPGVGVKTANVVLNVGFGMPRIAVDTHIFRVAARTGLATEKTPEKTGEALMKIVPEEYLLNAHHYLLLHGRYCCTARAPHCDSCPIVKYCKKNLQ